MRRIFPWCFVTLLIIFLISGCSSTTLTGSWSSPDYTNPVKKIYIVGVSKRETSRRLFEDEFGQSLQTYGVETVSSYKDLKNNQDADLDLLTKKVRANGADALLLTRILGKRTEEVVNPGRVSGYSSAPSYYDRDGYYPDRVSYRPEPYYRNYRSYYDRRYEMTYEPATISQFQVVTIESNLYDSASGELIWSAQLETVLDGTMESMIHDFIEVVTKDLHEQGVI